MKLQVTVTLEDIDEADIERSEGETVEDAVKENFKELLENDDITIETVDSVKEA